MAAFSFTVDGDPQPKLRPRVARTPKGVRTYTPDKTVKAEGQVRLACKLAMRARGQRVIEGAISLSVWVFLPVPSNLPKWQCGTALPVTRPDADNYLKLVMDGLNPTKVGPVIWRDDSQIVDTYIAKRYAWEGHPRIEVILIEVGADWRKTKKPKLEVVI